jgi:acetolactate synthase-1/2/3 large subunit
MAVAAAVELLKNASNPFIVLGGGTQDSPQHAQALVDRSGIRTALTINAKGVLPRAYCHPITR